MKKETLIILILIFLFGLFLYSASLKPVMLPKGSGIPDREIVFLSVDDKEYYLGFINPDGSGLEKRTVKMITGVSGYDSQLKKYTEWFHRDIQWAENGDAIGMQYFKYAPTGGIPFLINLDGEFTTCPVESDPIPMGLNDSGSIQFLGDGILLSVINTVGIETVSRYDMKSCQKFETLYKPNEDESLRGARLSNTDWLAVWHSVDQQEKITIFSPDKSIHAVIEDAEQPEWSKDGEHLAFVKIDSLYIASQDGTETRKILEGYINCPSWSPDGKKLVIEYLNNKKFNIAIVDITTGELTIIAENGYCPDWR